MNKKMRKLRIKSGNVTANDPLVIFLYELMRDHLTPGEVESLVMSSEDKIKTTYTNGWLAKYAKYLSKRLK